MDKRLQLTLDNLAAQRNVALDQLAATRAEVVIAHERIKELEADLAKLKPATEPQGPSET